LGGAETGQHKQSSVRLVIIASTLGTVFEWYDFFVYGTLATIIGQHFFPSGNASVSLLIALGTFGIGFGMRPIGAVLFGVLGDRLGRKYTFLITVAAMGGATAAVGLLPTYQQIGISASFLLLFLRVIQGLALGGEYGGAAVYVAEHSPAEKRGFYTSFINASSAGGFLLSLCVVVAANLFIPKEAWLAWGWRVPFLFSLVLLAVSLWVRLLLHESPVFREMQEKGEVARNPLRESFDSLAKWKNVAVALFGVSAGLTVTYYTAQFQSLYFVQNAIRIDDMPARLIVGSTAAISLFWYVFFGWLSDKVGRKPPILIGNLLAVLLMFPLFHWVAASGNPPQAQAVASAPVVVRGSDCRFDPFATGKQPTLCGQALDALSKRGVAYTKVEGAPGAAPVVTIGGASVDPADESALTAALGTAGYSNAKISPPLGSAIKVALGIMVLGVISGMTYGPAGALLVELFPARVRYTSLSIPYHIGSGYFGGFLPFIFQYIVARTGDPFAGLWYTVAVSGMAFVVMLFGYRETAGKRLE
jgi:nitrate/nitrite transporter NarK